MALYEVQGICQQHKNSGSGFLQQITVEAPDEERAEAKFEARMLNKHSLVNYVHINWVEEVESKSSPSSSSSSSSSSSNVRRTTKQAKTGGVDYVAYWKRYGKKTGDWSGYEKAVKREKDVRNKAFMAMGLFVASPFVLAFLMMTWEILLPLSVLTGGGYLYKKNQTKNNPPKVQDKYRKESIN